MRFGFLIDNRRCIGCHACSTACKSENEVPLGVNRTWVKYTETGAYPDVTRHFQVTRCNHCENPPCVAICPVSAMYQRQDGIVEFDKDVCIGCKACIQACPYDAIHIDPDNGTAAKCHFCSHRTDLGLEPACVVVCPEHAILAGDLDDPTSEIARTVANEAVTVRKPEQGTKPKLFYIEGNVASQNPLASPAGPSNFMFTDPLDAGHTAGPVTPPSPVTPGAKTEPKGRQAAQMVQVGFNAQHRIYWHWQVPAYIVTKDIATGIILLMALYADVLSPAAKRLGSGTALGFTLLTTLLLVFDLDRPERFLRILLRPQWRSWLTRGAFLLVGFSTLVTLIFGLEVGLYLELLPAELGGWTGTLLWITAPLAVLTSVYTAFLFGQAEGRDLWQQPLLPVQMFVRTVMAGAALLMLLAPLAPLTLPNYMDNLVIFAGALIVDLLLTLAGELAMPPTTETQAAAMRHMKKGAYRWHFWGGYLALGRLVPPLVLAVGFQTVWGMTLAPVLALVGLFLVEYAFVLAAQRVPNS